MNKQTEEILNKINDKTKEKPLFYFSRDSERAIGLENYLSNYKIACIEDSYISQQLTQKFGENIFCAEKENLNFALKSSLELVNDQKTQEWIKKLASNEFYFQLFQFNAPVQKNLKNLGGTSLNNSAQLNRLFENKFSQFKLLNEAGIKIPESFIVDSAKTSYSEIKSKIKSSNFVIQLDRAHTGSGTFVINSEDDWNNFTKQLSGNIIKISEYIQGEAYTINGCVTKKGTFIAGLQYQITGVPQLTNGVGTTVGNDWSFANTLAELVKEKIYKEMKKIGELMGKNSYRGLFGVDLIVRGADIFIIEINARQTANIPLQTKLEILQDKTPLELIHIAEFMNIDYDCTPESTISTLEGSQVFLRAKWDNFKVNHQLYPGIYRLQSDNSSRDWDTLQIKEKAILTDEDGDKPMIWQKEGYSIEDLKKDEGFVFLIQQKDSVKNKFDELARMQFKNQIVHDYKVSPWILEAMQTIEDIIR